MAVSLGRNYPHNPITQRSLVQIQPPQPRRDKGLAVAAADPFVVSATILQPLHRVSGYANCAIVPVLAEHQPERERASPRWGRCPLKGSSPRAPHPPSGPAVARPTPRPPALPRLGPGCRWSSGGAAAGVFICPFRGVPAAARLKPPRRAFN